MVILQRLRDRGQRPSRSTVLRFMAVASLGVALIGSGAAVAGPLGGAAAVTGNGTVTASPTDTGADLTWTVPPSEIVTSFSIGVTDSRTGSSFTALTHGNYDTVHLSDLTNGDPYTATVTALPLLLLAGQATFTPGATPFTPPPAVTVQSVTATTATSGAPALNVKLAAVPGGSNVNYSLAVAVDPAGVTVARALATGAGASTITLAPLEPNTAYRIAVASHTPLGQGPLTWATGSTGSAGCPTDACVTVSPTAQPFTPAVNGLLNDNGSGVLEHAAVSSLHPGFVRINAGYGSAPGTAAAVSGLGATLVENLADAWYDKTDSGLAGGIEPPWECWSCYSQFITSQASSIVGSGVHPAYWEVENEPGAAGTYPAHLQGDAALYLQQLEVAATAIRSVDPTARILAPTDGSFNLGSSTRTDQPTLPLDMVLANAANIPGFAGLDWHEISTTDIPAAAAEDVIQAKQLAAQAGLPNIVTVISEYTTPYDAPLAGAEATWMGALGQAGLTQASRACWANQPGEVSPLSTCQGMADGLVTSLGQITGPGQVAADYGALSANGANSATVTSSSPYVSATASTDASGVTTVLIGHEASCLPSTNTACPPSSVASSGPATIRLTVPVTTSQVTEQASTISSVTGPAQVSMASPTTLTAQANQVVVTVQIADGAAQQITLTPVVVAQKVVRRVSAAGAKSAPVTVMPGPATHPAKHRGHRPHPKTPHRHHHQRHHRHPGSKPGLVRGLVDQVVAQVCRIVCL